jgi:hypothetical protein
LILARVTPHDKLHIMAQDDDIFVISEIKDDEDETCNKYSIRKEIERTEAQRWNLALRIGRAG